MISTIIDILDSEGGFPTRLQLWNLDKKKQQHFLLHCKFSLSLSQQKCVGNTRNKTHRLSTFFCNQNHQNPFGSLRERVVWSCTSGFKNTLKTKMHTSWSYVFVKVTYIEHYCQYRHDLCVLVFDAFLKPPTQLQTTRSPRLLNGFWYFLVQNEEETSLVLFLISRVYFCWVETDEIFERN